MDIIEIKNLEIFANHGVFRRKMYSVRNSSYQPNFIPVHVKPV